MTRTKPAVAMLWLVAIMSLAETIPADAAPRHRRPHTYCTPVFIEGAGTVQI